MKPRLSVLTLGVSDLDRSLAFYGGYAGYFQDPDQYLREVVWNPAFVPADGEAS